MPKTSSRRRQASIRSAAAACEPLETRRLLASWTPVTAAPAGIETMMMLSDGTVLAQHNGVSKVWYKLTPNSAGSYVNGTWTQLASMGLERLYFASNVLKDGRVFLVGGEYSGSPSTNNWINSGEIYNPVTNAWSPITNFPNSQFGDDPSELLPDGRVLCGYLSGPQTYIFDPSTNQWSTAANKLNNDRSDEETWVKLPDDSILSYNIFGSPQSAQRYVPATNTWVAAGTCPVQLHTGGGAELGPALRIPDGRVVFIGGTNHNAIYNPATNAWAALADTPGNIGANDAPGAMLPNGHILYAAGDTSTSFSPPTSLFDMDPVNNTITAVSLAGGPTLSSTSAFNCRMLMLPTGQVLFTNGSNQLYAYNPDGSAVAGTKPVITNIQHSGSGVFTLTGTQLNGVSEGASYGDDAEMSSNYPIIRFMNGGIVRYARTHDWSSTGVATGSTPETVQFEFPAGLPAGTYQVQVIANGIASDSALDTEGTSGNDTIVVKVNGNGTQVDVNGVGAAFSGSVFNGELFVHAGFGNDSVAVNSASALTTLQVDTSIGNDVVTIEPISVSGSATVLLGDGDDSLSFSPSSQQLGLTANWNLDGGLGVNTVTFNDQARLSPSTDTLTDSNFNAFSNGIASFDYNNFRTMTFNLSSPGNTFRINSTELGSSVIVNGGAGVDDLFDGGGDINGIYNVTFNGGGGNDIASVNDTSGSVGGTYAFSPTGLTGPVFGLFSLNYSSLESLTINESTSGSTFNVNAVPLGMALTINAGGGNDNCTVGIPGAGNLDTVNGPVTFNGEAGSDHLTVNDQNQTRNDGYRITSTAVFKLLNGTTVENTINYSTDEAVTLNMGASTGNNTCNVDSTAAGTPVDINSGPMLNILRVNETNPTAPVTIDPAGGDDPVNVNSDNSGSAAVIFPATQRIGILAIGNGGVATVPAGGNKVLTITGISITNTGKLDLTNEDLIIDHAGSVSLATIQPLINSARANGAWTGGGITSTTARNNAQHNTTLGAMTAADYFSIYGNGAPFDGQTIDTTTILVKYTYYGDADFNGKVNFDDYVRTDTGFNNHRSGWVNGDYDGNGQVNFDDYVLIDLGFNTQSGTL